MTSNICKDKGKILNPATGRCVKRDGAIGKKLLAVQRHGAIKSSSKCDKDKVLNPATGRCVKRDGAIGKKLLANVTPVDPVGTPTKFLKIVEDCKKGETLNIRIREKLGQGSYGSSYKICMVGKCKYALKEQNADIDFKHEVDALYALNNWKHSPKIYAAWTCNGKGYFIQDLMYKCPRDPTYEQMRQVIGQLNQKGWVHVDVHEGNVMCLKDGTIVLIDFGWARNSKDGMVTDHALNEKYKIKEIPWSVLLMIEDVNIDLFYGEGHPWDKIIEKNRKLKELRAKEKTSEEKTDNKAITSVKKKLF